MTRKTSFTSLAMFASLSRYIQKVPMLFLGLITAIALFAIVTPTETSFIPHTFADSRSAIGINETIRPDAAQDDVSLQESIVKIINQFLLFLGILLLIIIIYAGILIITSDGEEEGLTKGRKMIIYAIIGVIIIFLSYSIVNWIGGIGNSDGNTQ